MSVPLALLFEVAGGVRRVARSVAAPVIGMTLTPALLGRCPVGPVAPIRLELVPLPAPFPLTLRL
jgi:hypothetical protein